MHLIFLYNLHFYNSALNIGSFYITPLRIFFYTAHYSLSLSRSLSFYLSRFWYGRWRQLPRTVTKRLQRCERILRREIDDGADDSRSPRKQRRRRGRWSVTRARPRSPSPHRMGEASRSQGSFRFDHSLSSAL